jgi:hypothetical protein
VESLRLLAQLSAAATMVHVKSESVEGSRHSSKHNSMHGLSWHGEHNGEVNRNHSLSAGASSGEDSGSGSRRSGKALKALQQGEWIFPTPPLHRAEWCRKRCQKCESASRCGRGL